MAFVYLIFITMMQTSFEILVMKYYSDLRHTLYDWFKSHIRTFLIHLGDHPRCVSVCLFSGIYSIFAFTFFIFNSHLLLQWTRFESETKTDNLTEMQQYLKTNVKFFSVRPLKANLQACYCSHCFTTFYRTMPFSFLFVPHQSEP